MRALHSLPSVLQGKFGDIILLSFLERGTCNVAQAGLDLSLPKRAGINGVCHCLAGSVFLPAIERALGAGVFTRNTMLEMEMAQSRSRDKGNLVCCDFCLSSSLLYVVSTANRQGLRQAGNVSSPSFDQIYK